MSSLGALEPTVAWIISFDPHGSMVTVHIPILWVRETDSVTLCVLV